jgi:SAM-dependent methyltransferase
MKYQDINSKTIDSWVDSGWIWGEPISHETFLNVKEGKWDILLTPTKNMPHYWIGDIKGKRVLGLASGGGQQMPILMALGAICTVLDYSKKQLESEQIVANREHYEIKLVHADMTKPLPFLDEEFDIVINPVSLVYAEKLEPIFLEINRVLKRNGIFISGLDTGINFLFDNEEKEVINKLPFNPLTSKDNLKQLQDSDGGMQFSHTIEEIIGGQLKAGFILTDIYEDTNGEGNLHEHNVPSYIATRSIKK